MGAKEDTEHEKKNWHWRNSMRPVRFFRMDARATIIYFGLMPFWAHPWAWALMIINTILFMYLESKGLTFPSAIRSFRTWLLGQQRPAWLTMRKRRMIDYG